MPSRLLPVRPLAALGLAFALAGCGSAGQAAAPAAPAQADAALDAAGLAALADDRPSTSLPPAAVTAEHTAAALLATQPAPEPVGTYGAAQVRDALAFAAELVAATRADRERLCGPPGASPAAAVSTPRLQRWLADPANAAGRTEMETTISASGTTEDCGPLRWVGPGVVLGPQAWSVAPGTDGAGLDVSWSGSMGYALADGQGAPEPWGLRGRVVYGLRLDGGRWRLSGWADGARGRVAQGWPADVPLPDGYLAEPDAPAGDPAALQALRDAAAAWRAAPGVTAAVDAYSAKANLGHGKDPAAARLAGTYAVAPARGDAAGSVTVNGTDRTRTAYAEGGTVDLVESLRPLTARPGRTVPPGARWTRDDDPASDDQGAGYDINPFRIVSLLDAAAAAAPADCPRDAPAAGCYTAVVVTSADGPPLASTFTGQAHRGGRPYVVLTAGLDDQGRPAFVRVEQTARAFGADYSDLTGTTTFAGYSDAPPPPALPDPSAVASVDDTRS